MLLKDFYKTLYTITNNISTIDLYLNSKRIGCFRYRYINAHNDDAKQLLKEYGEYEVKEAFFGTNNDHNSICEIHI